MANCFQTVYSISAQLNPHKRVNFATGLVLGQDEFLQEQLYFQERDRRHHRGLHGHGIVSGLAVSVDNNAPERRVQIESGMAIDRDGRIICVTRPQCGSLLDWVREQGSALSPVPGYYHAYAVLCHTECETDAVPIPAGPCLSHDDRSVASRVLDSFKLEFRLPENAPLHIDDEVIAKLSDIFAAIEIVTDPSEADPPELLIEQIESLVSETSDALSPGSPVDVIRATSETVRNALGHWVRVVRPKLYQEMGQQAIPCAPWERQVDGGSDDPCVLLARLDFQVDAIGSDLVIVDDVHVDYKESPVLLHSSLLQELGSNSTLRALSIVAQERSTSVAPEPMPSPQPISRTIAIPPAYSIRMTGTPRPTRSVLGSVPTVRFRPATDPNGALPAITLPVALSPDLDLNSESSAVELRVRLQWVAPALVGLGRTSWDVLLNFFSDGAPLTLSEEMYSRQSILMRPLRTEVLSTAISNPFRIRIPATGIGNMLIRLVTDGSVAANSNFHLVMAEVVYTTHPSESEVNP